MNGQRKTKAVIFRNIMSWKHVTN